MACEIAANEPLSRLRDDLGLAHQCHSIRVKCFKGLSRRSSELALGVPGAALGYCQALFNYSGSPSDHSMKVARCLSEINAPWSQSHELYWGYRTGESPEGFMEAGMRPLLGSGRVPVVITGLDARDDFALIDRIVSSRPPVVPGETVLVRIVLKSNHSAKSAASLVTRLVDKAEQNAEMPPWWPLFQSDGPVDLWNGVRRELGERWRYVNVAINPFTPKGIAEFIGEQVTVAQTPIGLARGMSDEGTIRLEPGMVISGAPDSGEWRFDEFMRTLLEVCSAVPTLIVLGPSLPSWSDKDNIERIQRFLPLLRKACAMLWRGLSASRQEEVWRLSA